jgi:chromosome partitioning protein
VIARSGIALEATVPILTISSSKGGVGKTTLAQLLAAAVARDGLSVVVIDADANQGLVGWVADIYEGPSIRAVAETDDAKLAHLMPEMAAAADLVIVDTAGFGNVAAAVAMAGSDAVLVPAQPGRADLLEAERTVQRVRGLARASRRDIPVRVLLNRVQRTTGLTRHAITEAGVLDLPRLDTMLSHSVGFGEIGFTGRLPVASPAVDEVAMLLAELRALGWLPVPATGDPMAAS